VPKHPLQPPRITRTAARFRWTSCRRCRWLRVLASARRGASRRHPTDAPAAFRGSADRRKEPGPRLGSARDDEPESFPPLFLWGRTLLPVSLVLLPGLAGLFLCGASGHTRRCRQPTDETPGRRGCRHGCPPTPARDRKPGNAATAFRRPGWKAVAAVRVLAGRCLGWFSPGVSQTEVGRKRYPDNLCEPPLVWSNFFRI
jgi:hypothetical protein